MSIAQVINATIGKFGNSIRVECADKSVNIKGFIEPLRYKNKMYLNGVVLPPGYYDGGHYLFIAPKNSVFDGNTEKTVIYMKGKGYVIKRLENYVVSDETVYVWAVLTPYVEPMEDDYDVD